jgi:hypothetical protein
MTIPKYFQVATYVGLTILGCLTKKKKETRLSVDNCCQCIFFLSWPFYDILKIKSNAHFILFVCYTTHHQLFITYLPLDSRSLLFTMFVGDKD